MKIRGNDNEGNVEQEIGKGEPLKMPQIIKEAVNDDQETKTEEEIKLREEEREIVNDVQETKT